MPSRNGKEIALIDLATHYSGLPRLPANMGREDRANPYADYTVDQMYQFLSGYTLPRDIGAQFEYSNYGVGLLGNALTRRAGMDYEALVRSRIADPLGMTSTRVALTPEMKARFATGYNAEMKATPYWDLPTFAGAGALRSTANDLMNFLAANIGLTKSPLAPAMATMLATKRPAGAPGLTIGLGWMVATPPAPMHQVVWHNGGTGGFRSFIGFDRERRIGVVVLSNAGTAAGVDDIGGHLFNQQAPLVKPPEKKEHREIAIDQKLLDGYVGKYEFAPGFVITVARVGNHLSAQATNQGAFEIFPEGDRAFFAKVTDIQIAFETDAQGKATAMLLTQMGATQRAKRMP
jgi:CubicO group peptidase (beta-lactamase class C family)